MKCKLLLYCFLFTMAATAFGQGTVIDDSFFSASLNEIRNVDVYLPACYDPANINRRYPVVHFLHGVENNQNGYPELIEALDDMIGNGIIEPVIVAKADGSVAPFLGSMYTNSALYGQFEDYIVRDLVAYIDSTYNTLASRDWRVVMGHSMGGYGAMKLGLRHPDVYRALASHSGPLDFDDTINIFSSRVLQEHGSTRPFSPNAGNWSELLFTSAGAFSPNMNNPPYYVDLPFDDQGNIIQSVRSRWLAKGPRALANQYSPEAGLAIYFDCGSNDEPWYAQNVAFAKTLDSLALPHEFQEYVGGHANLLRERFGVSLVFFDSLMVQGTARAFNTTVDRGYAIPGTDEVVINTKISNPRNHTLTVLAKLKDVNTASALETVELFDDGSHHDGTAGDGLWGSSWPVSKEERTYAVEMSVADIDSGLTESCENVARFTTIGPLVFEGYTIKKLGGRDDGSAPKASLTDKYSLKLTLKNEGATVTATTLTARLASNSNWLAKPFNAARNFADISAGASVISSGSYTIELSANYPEGTDIPLYLSIASEGHFFWSDTFAIRILTTAVQDEEITIPATFVLNQNYPNPFNPETVISYQLSAISEVELAIYDLLGRHVVTLVQASQPAGIYTVKWDGKEQRGNSVASGIYFFRLDAGAFSAVKKMSLLR